MRCPSPAATTAASSAPRASRACAPSAARTAPNLRVALARAFVRARFGDAVDTPPEKPHQVRGGKIEPYDAGEPIPQHGDASATGNAGDIRSVPRM
ncbi:hypothetical protein Y047_4758 [Burkholderia pseudomallei MSHR3016]|nr:hypothetical protein Y047_4758 [Burkholderia pseudomallei MSHR3016]